jgi:hypothetical protein
MMWCKGAPSAGTIVMICTTVYSTALVQPTSDSNSFVMATPTIFGSTHIFYSEFN